MTEESAYLAGFKDAQDNMVEAIATSRSLLSKLNILHWRWALTGYQEGLSAASRAVLLLVPTWNGGER